MTEYIERAAAVKIAEKYGTCNGSVLGRHSGVADSIASEIAGLSAADVVPTWWARHPISSGEFGSCRNPISMLFGWPLAMADSTETVQSGGNTPQRVKIQHAADIVPVVHGRCPICRGTVPILQDCNNGYSAEIEGEEMSIWCGDECVAIFSIDFCPACGAKMDGGADDAADRRGQAAGRAEK